MQKDQWKLALAIGFFIFSAGFILAQSTVPQSTMQPMQPEITPPNAATFGAPTNATMPTSPSPAPWPTITSPPTTPTTPPASHTLPFSNLNFSSPNRIQSPTTTLP